MSGRSDLKAKLKEKKTLFGTFIKVKDPALVECCGYAGFDFIIVDDEHGSFSFSDAENLVRAAEVAHIAPVMRIPCCPHALTHALDIGMSAVMIPSLTNVTDAERIASFSKYSPRGNRGTSIDQKSARYGFCSPGEYFKSANENTMLILQLESKELLDQLEAFLSVKQLDMVFIGPGDLSDSFGKSGDLECPEVQTAVQHITAACQERNIPVGIYAGTPAQAQRYAHMGIQFIAFSTDLMLYQKTLTESMHMLSNL